ncbi:MAG: ABC transporter permease subunit [Alphaproteobacteria bacterium]|nr:ABC transporter permease subunit [Alphaproteobacteria bacterium]
MRDTHALALLFLMPTIFILVMSLALQDVFAARSGAPRPATAIKVELSDFDQSDASRDLTARLETVKAFGWTTGANRSRDDMMATVKAGDQTFGVIIPKGYGEQLAKSATPAALRASTPETAPPGVEVLVAPDAEKRSELIFLAALRNAMGRQRVDTALSRFAPPRADGEPAPEPKADVDPVTVTYTYDAAKSGASPSAVQQNVPAWLVFSIFFVAIPFAQTFIRERDLGTQRRLRTTNLASSSQIFGKLLPYYGVNQVQVVLMFCVGIFIVPLLGGEALQLRGDPVALVLMGVSVSFAALGLALLIAAIARTSEQASMMSALGNIILGAFGGIMVPRFVMPEAMRALSGYSPMAWGLDGFLELLLHGGGVRDIVPEVLKLGALGTVAIVIALGLHRRQE